MFSEASVILIQKPVKNIIRKENYREYNIVLYKIVKKKKIKSTISKTNPVMSSECNVTILDYFKNARMV